MVLDFTRRRIDHCQSKRCKLILDNVTLTITECRRFDRRYMFPSETMIVSGQRQHLLQVSLCLKRKAWLHLAASLPWNAMSLLSLTHRCNSGSNSVTQHNISFHYQLYAPSIQRKKPGTHRVPLMWILTPSEWRHGIYLASLSRTPACWSLEIPMIEIRVAQRSR